MLKCGGYTLVELSVVIGIIILLSAIIFPNYRSGQKELSWQRAAYKLSRDLRQAQEMTLSVKEIGKGLVPAGKEFVPRGGYGIYFNLASPEKYFLFADCDDNQEFSSGNVCGPPGFQFSELIEEIKIEKGVKIKSLSSSSLHITFKPPEPSTNIRPLAASAFIELEGGKRVRVGTTGLINIE